MPSYSGQKPELDFTRSPFSAGGCPDDPGSAFTLLPPDPDLEIITELILEVREHIAVAETALLSLETSPGSREDVHAVFRAFHSIKGSAGSAGLQSVAELSHRTESLLDRVRDGSVEFGGPAADLALQAVDMLRKLLEEIAGEIRGQPASLPAAYAGLVEALSRFDPRSGQPPSKRDPGNPLRLGDILVAEGKVTREQIEAVVARQGAEPLGRALLKSKVASLTDVARALRTQQRLSQASSDEASLRVRTEQVDRLLDLVNQLVGIQRRVFEDPLLLKNTHQDLFQNVSDAGQVIREIQALTLSMRMVSLKDTFLRTARIARDTARKAGKQVNFVTLGESTEIDRRMAETLEDPLAHLVRNAVDHGIESPEVREARGKQPTGTVLLCAYQSGGSLVVELQDDGNGIDRQKIIDRAVTLGLATPELNPAMRDTCELICTPGLSTAEAVTQTSGRGVGMDVVKRSVDALGGSLRLTSEPGRGSTFSLRLPLALATIDGLLAGVGPEVCIIPRGMVRTCLDALPPVAPSICGPGEAITDGGEQIPLVRLHRHLGVAGGAENPAEGVLVVVESAERRLALLVDRLLGEQIVITRRRQNGQERIPGFSCVALLGDGRIGRVIDPEELGMAVGQP